MHCTDCTPRPAQVLRKDKERDCCYLQPEQEASVATLTNDSNDTVISHYVEFRASSKCLDLSKILTIQIKFQTLWYTLSFWHPQTQMQVRLLYFQGG